MQNIPPTPPSSPPVKVASNKKSRTQVIARMGVFVALLILGALISIPIPFSPVVITLQTLVIMLITIAFKPPFAIATLLIYIAMGSAGLPVFSALQNFSVYFNPGGGFIIGFVPATLFMSYSISLLEKKIPHSLINKKNQSFNNAGDIAPIKNKQIILKSSLLVTIAIIFTAIYMIIGALWFMYVFMPLFAATPTNITFGAALMAVVVPFLPGEAIKITAAVIAYPALIKFRNK